MMSTSVVNLVTSTHRDTTTIDDLSAQLESLPSFHNLSNSIEDQSGIFDDDGEPAVGVIHMIRKNSMQEDLSNASSTLNPISTDDANSYYSADDETISTSNSTAVQSEVNPDEQNQNEDANDENHLDLLRSKQRHLFILSENGKPVFTRYGDEEHLITLMGVMQTLVSFSEVTQSSHLNYIKAGRCRVAFLHKEPLIFVLVTHINENPVCLTQQLNCAYNQIISTLTLSRIKQKFSVQPNFDLRRWLSNAEKKLLHNIIDMYEKDLGLVLTCAKCLPLPYNLRTQIGQTVAQTIRGQKDMIFAIVLAHGQLVSIARLRSYHLHPSDLHVIINLVNSSDAFKGVESWVPICLPRFDSGGCLHAHISYLDDTCDVCVVLMTVNPEHFQILSDFKQKIAEKFKKLNAITQIRIALTKERFLPEDIVCPELHYFVYKSRNLSQYTSSTLVPPYDTSEQHVRLFQMIRYIYGRLHDPGHQLKIIYHTGEHESILGWLAPGFEMYGVFSRLVQPEAVISAIDRILMYIKREENQLFIMKCEHF